MRTDVVRLIQPEPACELCSGPDCQDDACPFAAHEPIEDDEVEL